MAVPKINNDDLGYYLIRFKSYTGGAFTPDWDDSLYMEFYDSDDTLQFTATISSNPALVEKTDAEGSYIEITGIDISTWSLGISTVKVYAKQDGVDIEPSPFLSNAFDVIEAEPEPTEGRVSSADVEKIIDVDSSIDIDTFIASAHLMVENVLSNAGYTEGQLTEIERWLSAHLVSMMQRQILNERLGDASVSYAGMFGKGLEFTQYGQQVMLLEYKNVFRNMEKKSMGFVAL